MDILDSAIEKIEQKPPALMTREEVMQICEMGMESFIHEPNTLRLSSPILVVGDIHGQLYDMFEIFRIEPPPPQCQYLFLGDYVDRGDYSLETFMYLLCLRLKFPDKVHLLRGNHETYKTNATYGFYKECMQKYNDPHVYQAVYQLFHFLPIAAMIDNRIFAVHGGLSPSIHLIDQIDAIDRFQEVPDRGAITDLLWSDPETSISGFKDSTRGAGYLFGRDVTERFAHLNRLSLICRAHQLALNGYQNLFDGLLTTVWSAPNYSRKSFNLASVMTIGVEGDRFGISFNVFEAVPSGEITIPPESDIVPQYFL